MPSSKNQIWTNRPSNLAIRSILYFPTDEDYVFITNQNVDPSVIKDINYGILNHLLEFQIFTRCLLWF